MSDYYYVTLACNACEFFTVRQGEFFRFLLRVSIFYFPFSRANHWNHFLPFALREAEMGFDGVGAKGNHNVHLTKKEK
jgi:hypothetical protein